MTTTTIILLSLLLGSSYAFAPPLKLQRQLRDARAASALHLAPPRTSVPPLVPEALSPIVDETQTVSEHAACLELDQVQGCIRQGSRRVLLNGLNPSIWRGSRVVEGDDSSLFLHTKRTEKSAKLETSLGDLVSCKRLLACART